MSDQKALLAFTTDIIAAFVSNNTVRTGELPDLIAAVHASVTAITSPKPVELVPDAPTPAVSVKKSITSEYLICLDDGKKFKSLRRHLATLGMTPDDYRARWGLPSDYPMVAPGYAAKRSQLAKANGLGSDRRRGVLTSDLMGSTALEPAMGSLSTLATVVQTAMPEPVEAPAPEALPAQQSKRRGRPRKAA